jgi:hypothetical protein
MVYIYVLKFVYKYLKFFTILNSYKTMQRLSEREKDELAEYVEKIYLYRYHTLPRIIYTPLGIEINLHLYPSFVIIKIFKNYNMYAVDYTKFYNLNLEEPLNELTFFDDIDDVYNYITYIVDSMKPPRFDF